MATAVNKEVKNAWWLFTIQGIVTLLFGLVAMFWPGMTAVTLVWLFALYVIVWGIVDLISGFAKIGHSKHWWLTLLGGLVGLAIGMFLIRNLTIALATAVALMGLFLVAHGIFEIVTASVFEGTGQKVLAIIAGVIAIIAGIAIWVYPVRGGLAFVWVLGLFAVIRGTIDIAMAISARHEVDQLTALEA